MSKTTLFDKYYNNPTKSYIYANMACNGTSADEISFDITKEQGVISDNEKNLSSIDLHLFVVYSSFFSDNLFDTLPANHGCCALKYRSVPALSLTFEALPAAPVPDPHLFPPKSLLSAAARIQSLPIPESISVCLSHFHHTAMVQRVSSALHSMGIIVRLHDNPEESDG